MKDKMYWIFGMVLFLGGMMGLSLPVYAQGKNYTVTVNGVKLEMVYVKGGTFMMGATEEQGSDAFDWEKPAHEVTLTDYYIGKYEVTQGLWKAVMGSNPSYFQKGDNYPVENVSWDDIQTFLMKLNQMTGKKYALPTEAQWEYAARSGKGGNKFVHVWCGGGAIALSGVASGSSGSGEATKYSGSDNIDEVAWYNANSGSTTHPVGTKQPNALGLYDMSGNVWEWCRDRYGSYSSGAQTDPTGPSTGSSRVFRGGGWGNDARYCRVSYRNGDSPVNRLNFLGFRVVCLP